MKIGCHLPVSGPVGTRDNVIAFARRIEALGYDSLWASDHVVLPHRMTTPYPYNPTGQFPLAPDVPFLAPLPPLAPAARASHRGAPRPAAAAAPPAPRGPASPAACSAAPASWPCRTATRCSRRRCAPRLTIC